MSCYHDVPVERCVRIDEGVDAPVGASPLVEGTAQSAEVCRGAALGGQGGGC
ncbi:hypothetical protein NON19_12080 [Streptomyces rubrisoli]|uniref:Uncharacterized protein n=1 Tax=Streptantibioticus rubrisoli TaxID=1387313 RepID=A0ABT1PBJ2_9ACTN|nr:hypothetical protein [Streptantibioticus rubrisoli]MCQ4042746.1 hypothetical protein [Streptantibioticus rubrisoli]